MRQKRSDCFSPIDWYVDRQLKRWAKYSIALVSFGLGYPTKTLEARLSDAGGIISKSTAPAQVVFDDESEKIEQLLSELYRYKSGLATAIRIKYTTTDLRRDLETNSLPLPTFNKYLSEARVWLAAHLGADGLAYFRNKPAANQ